MFFACQSPAESSPSTVSVNLHPPQFLVPSAASFWVLVSFCGPTWPFGSLLPTAACPAIAAGPPISLFPSSVFFFSISFLLTDRLCGLNHTNSRVDSSPPLGTNPFFHNYLCSPFFLTVSPFLVISLRPLTFRYNLMSVMFSLTCHAFKLKLRRSFSTPVPSSGTRLLLENLALSTDFFPQLPNRPGLRYFQK